MVVERMWSSECFQRWLATGRLSSHKISAPIILHGNIYFLYISIYFYFIFLYLYISVYFYSSSFTAMVSLVREGHGGMVLKRIVKEELAKPGSLGR